MNLDEARGVAEEGSSAEDAFELFTNERYGRVVSAVTMIVRDRATAEDITQETFARAYINWPKLWPDGNPAGWVHRVSTNLAMTWHRRAGREIRAVARLGKRTDFHSPEPEVYPELHREIAALPRRQRAAVALFYLLGLSEKETAEAMKVPVGTVKSTLHAARHKLREKLGEDAR